jgi:hypothetical protein
MPISIPWHIESLFAGKTQEGYPQATCIDANSNADRRFFKGTVEMGNDNSAKSERETTGN